MRLQLRRARWRLLMAAMSTLLLAGLVAACSGEESDDEGDDVASLAEDEEGDEGEADASGGRSIEDIDPEEIEELELEFAQCMRDEGVDFPDPGGEIPQDLYDDPNFESASEACEPIIEEAVGDIELTPEMRAEMQEAMVAFAECMRDQGIDYPDPTFDESGMPNMEMPDDWDPTDSDTQRAFEECGEELAGLGPTP